MNQVNNQTERKVAKSENSRRQFLKKASTGVLISSLPAKSVWGACTVSGALSGNTSRIQTDCVPLNLFGGRSPGFWRDADNKIPGRALADAFPYLKEFRKNSDRYKCEYDTLQHEIYQVKQHQVDLGFNKSGQQVTLMVGDALSSPGGIAWNLAAVYLSAYFGFFDHLMPIVLPSGDLIETAEELVAHLFAYDHMEYLTDRDFGFTDGSTHYQASATECASL
jgi:hypothetical protein